MKSAKLIIAAIAAAASHDAFGSWDDSSLHDSLALLQMRSQVIKKTEGHPHWAYDGESGPSEWASIAPDCAGTSQSPIDLPVDASYVEGGGLEVSYEPVEALNLKIKNNGHALQVNGPFGHLVLPDGLYKVLQLHFHCPSEHAEGGKLASCEMHIVHQKVGSTGTADLAVIGILFSPAKEVGESAESGLELAFLRRLGLANRLGLPDAGVEKPIADIPIDLGTTFRRELSGGYYHYQGSLTTPPCSETVHWYVMKTHAAISEEMIENINMLFPGAANNRPLQPLNTREVVSNEEAIEGEFDSTEEGHKFHWTYGEQDKWVSGFPACGGTSQSPIDLNGVPVSTEGQHLNSHVKYHESKGAGLRLENNGHSLQVNSKDDIGYLALKDGKYNALQMHFHFPSEHSVDGKLAAGEMHIVHQKEGSTGTNDLAVVSILIDDVKTLGFSFETGTETAFFRDLGFGGKGKLPSIGERRALRLDDVDLSASFATQLAGPFWHYQGSLTTPPCSETVHWYVLQKRAAMTTRMIAQFKELYPNPANNRKVQPRGDRPVTMDIHFPGEFE